MEFIATCFAIFFSLIGFSLVVLFAALYCLETFEGVREQRRIEGEKRQFNSIVNRP